MRNKFFIAWIIFIIVAVCGAAAIIGFRLGYTPTSPSPNTVTNSPSQLSCIQKLPNSMKFGQKMMFAAYSSSIESSANTLVQHNVNGIIAMDNIGSQTLSSFSSQFAIAPTIATDQEGGTVQRYKDEGIVPGAADMANGFSPQQAYALYLKDSHYLRQTGITTNFAPVIDVESQASSPLPGRIYSSDPSTITEYAKQFILASQKANITPVVKHFPGLGSASANTDYQPATTDPLPTLKNRDLLPYTQLAALHPDAMVSNAIVPGLTNGQPAVWSPEAVALLRSYGYSDAVVYTDSLTAAAIPGDLYTAVIKAWAANIDVALIVEKPSEVSQIESYINAMESDADQALASHTLSQDQIDQSVERIFKRKHIDACTLQ